MFKAGAILAYYLRRQDSRQGTGTACVEIPGSSCVKEQTYKERLDSDLGDAAGRLREPSGCLPTPRPVDRPRRRE